ncbi:MAG TPA: prenyltransferase/squalene oxidase repeat-containing protein [Phototrophicaceae bacterium]|nr:prenyltransferase/squalene oxidase repeat-containing protein [Phototrophicaceae bacterium]
MDQAVTFLNQSQNSDGGWGAIAGKQSNTESTALGLLALRSLEESRENPAVRKAEQWLTNSQNSDGSWAYGAGAKTPSWSTALAVMALSDSALEVEPSVKAGNWILAQEGSKPGILAKLILALSFQKKAVHLNDDLIGWSWTAGSFSWVEPTSYCLLALKKMKARLSAEAVKERVDQAELMIYDRMCEGGGWNYGNAAVYGDPLWPYPDITALALIALQDHRERNENQVSLRVLAKAAETTDSGLALGWSSICLSLYGHDNSELRKRLEQKFVKTKFLGETKPIALSILAAGDGPSLFRV